MSDTHSVADTKHDGYDTVTLSSPADVHATFAPDIGMIGCSLRLGNTELLGQRNGLGAYADHGSTMGIPLLAPWANRLDRYGYGFANTQVTIDPNNPLIHDDGNGLPIHGILAASPYWEVLRLEADENAAYLEATLDFAAHPEYVEVFPFPHELDLDVTLQGDALEIATTLTATGDVDVPAAFGFHPYFAPPGPRPEWHVHLAVERRVILDERGIPTDEVEIIHYPDEALLDRTFDDLYDRISADRTFRIWGDGVEIDMQYGDHFHYAQVYAPPDDDVIAIEPMTAPVNPFDGDRPIQMVEPGDSLTAAFEITVRPSDEDGSDDDT